MWGQKQSSFLSCHDNFTNAFFKTILPENYIQWKTTHETNRISNINKTVLILTNVSRDCWLAAINATMGPILKV